MIGTALSTVNLVKRYGRRAALDGFTLSVPQNAVMGLVGPNGAGKTTWMMTVAGFLRPNSGSVDLLGRGPFDAAVHAGRFSILPQDSEFPLEAAPVEILYHYGRLQGLSASAARKSTDEMLTAVNLRDRARSPFRTLSHGMRKRVLLAQCFLGEPEVVLLDEPLNGLDPAEQDRMRRFILSRRGRQTVVVSSHNLNDVQLLCSHVAFVDHGRVVRMDTVNSLTREAGHIEYALARVSDRRADLVAAVTEAVPSVQMAWRSENPSTDAATLVCTYDATLENVASVNRLVLPILLERVDVLSVSAGLSLEQAYLSSR